MTEFDKKAKFWAEFEQKLDKISTEDELRDLLNNFVDVYVLPKYTYLGIDKIPVYFDDIQNITEEMESEMTFSNKKLTEKGRRKDYLEGLCLGYSQKYGIPVKEMLDNEKIPEEEREKIRIIAAELVALNFEGKDKEDYFNEKEDFICINNKELQRFLQADKKGRRVKIMDLFSNITHEYRHYTQYIVSNDDRFTLLDSGKEAKESKEYKKLIGNYSKKAVKTIIENEKNTLTDNNFYMLKDFIKRHSDVFGEQYTIKNFDDERITKLGFVVAYGSYISQEHEIDARMFALDVMREVEFDVSRFNLGLALACKRVIEEMELYEQENFEYAKIFHTTIHNTVASILSDNNFYNILKKYDLELESVACMPEEYRQAYKVRGDVLREILNVVFNVIDRDSFARTGSFGQTKRHLQKFKYAIYEEFISQGIIFASDIMKKNFRQEVKNEEDLTKIYVSILKKNLIKKIPMKDRSFYDIKNVSLDDRVELFKLCLDNDQIIYAENIATSFYGGISDKTNEQNEFFEKILPLLEDKAKCFEEKFKEDKLLFDDIDAVLNMIEDMSFIYSFNKEKQKGENSKIKQETIAKFEEIDDRFEDLGLSYVNQMRKYQGLPVYEKEECFYYRKGKRADREDYLLKGQVRDFFIKGTYGGLFKE